MARLFTTCDSADELDTILERSPWGSRGWCFQEKALSHRAILFTSEGVFLQCQEATFMLDGTRIADSKHAPSTKLFAGRTVCHRPQARKPNFPSWSWLGWDSSVIFERGLLNSAHAHQMTGDERGEVVVVGRGIEVRYPSHRLRKPAALSLDPHAKDGIFGFPASLVSGFFNKPSLDLVASIADLRISPSPGKIEDSNGLYAVYPAICVELSLRCLPPYGVYTNDAPPRHGDQTLRIYDVKDHEDHGACEVKKPVGFIWLNCAWRDSRPKALYMEFMALSGHPGAGTSESWCITMLMCLLKPDSCKRYDSYERLQVMDCCITEATWMSIGAATKMPHIL
ncbi:hypothetical protein CSAL01_00356 [Colletotrichum salicis]|uniref:Heterokaryon incompatibility domain-containing protein n=1 Tax=Colletotrichum salicis TaxID=1209931 RepID=A0A135RSW1_9PEZI|nr:hypothetical protein CSAL01_00356 [Colletotrichum salicis]